MPERTTLAAAQQTPTTPTRPDRHHLESAIAETAAAAPGVLRLEPTLGTTGLRSLLRRQPTDGVQVTVRDQLVDADINIATSTSHQALAVAEHLHRLIVDLITATGHPHGTILINVLTIDPPSAP